MNSRCAHCKSPVQHARTKHKAITTPARLILPFSEYKVCACVALACPTGHDCAHHDCDEDTHQDEEKANVCEFGQRAVSEHDDETRDPGNDEVSDKDMPALEGVARVEETVHRDDLVGENRGDGCRAEDPAQRIPPVWY